MTIITDRPLTSLQGVILTTGPFIFLWSILRGYVLRNGPIRLARPFTRVNNLAYALFSIALGCLIVNDIFGFYFDTSTSGPFVTTDDLAYVYHLSKLYEEYIDVLALVASGTTIGPHMAFHHITMPFYTYFRVLNASEWQCFAALNCLHHVLLYAYFGGVAVLRPVLPVTGWVQLIGGIAVDVRYLAINGSEAAESTNRAIGVLLLARYAMLFYEELKGKKKAGKETADQVKMEKKE